MTNYEFVPATTEAGDTRNLYLTWEILGHTGLKEKMFLQALNSQGNPVGQQEIEPISRKMYRWRDDGMILEQYPINTDARLSPGLYFVRLGFFNPKTGEHLPAYSVNKQPLGDEWIIGTLFMSANGLSLILLQHPLQAMFGDEFELLGYSMYPAEIPDSTLIELYWKMHAPVDTGYTVFVQLLNQQNRLIAQVDTQPLSNIYPTSRWQQGDIILDDLSCR